MCWFIFKGFEYLKLGFPAIKSFRDVRDGPLSGENCSHSKMAVRWKPYSKVINHNYQNIMDFI